jgi:hypothetical protein
MTFRIYTFVVDHRQSKIPRPMYLSGVNIRTFEHSSSKLTMVGLTVPYCRHDLQFPTPAAAQRTWPVTNASSTNVARH